jgi:hypothetical protein
MSTIQYLPLAEPITFTADAVLQPSVLLDLPRARPWIVRDYAAEPPVIALPYDFPLQAPPPLPLAPRRLVRETSAQAPPIASPYDLPIQAPPPLPLQARRIVWDTHTPEWGRADTAIVPTFFEAYGDLLRARQRTPPSTQSTEFGRTDVPPVPAPDLIGASMPDVMRRVRMKMGVVEAYLDLPPGYPPEWFPQPQTARAKARLTGEAFAAPALRPTVPFDPAQGTADLPQPQAAPRRPEAIGLKGGIPIGPPSPALTPPGTMPWPPALPVPPRRALARQPQNAPASNVVPIIPAAAPTGSLFPEREIAMLRVRRIQWDSGFAQNLPPISTPAYLSTFWNTYQPNEPIRWRGLLPALQQAYASVPPETTVVALFGAWRPEMPDWLARVWRVPPPSPQVVPQPSVIASLVGCIMVATPATTSSTLLTPDTAEGDLLDAECTEPTFTDPEVC